MIRILYLTPLSFCKNPLSYLRGNHVQDHDSAEGDEERRRERMEAEQMR